MKCALTGCENEKMKYWEAWVGEYIGPRVLGYCCKEHAKENSDSATLLLTRSREKAKACIVEHVL